MDVHPIKNGINRYWSIPIWLRGTKFRFQSTSVMDLRSITHCATRSAADVFTVAMIKLFLGRLADRWSYYISIYIRLCKYISKFHQLGFMTSKKWPVALGKFHSCSKPDPISIHSFTTKLRRRIGLGESHVGPLAFSRFLHRTWPEETHFGVVHPMWSAWWSIVGN